MTVTELEERASLALAQGRPAGVVRWLGHIEKRGLALSRKQRAAKEEAGKILSGIALHAGSSLVP
jgi:hypothetical protein